MTFIAGAVVILTLLAQAQEQVPEALQPLVDFARDNPVVAIGAVVVVLFLTSLLPRSRRSYRRQRTYGGRTISYHLGKGLGDIVRGRSRKR